MVIGKDDAEFIAGGQAPDTGLHPVTSADVKAAWAVMAALFLALFLLV